MKEITGFPCGLVVKNLPVNAGHTDSIPGLGWPHRAQRPSRGGKACGSLWCVEALCAVGRSGCLQNPGGPDSWGLSGDERGQAGPDPDVCGWNTLRTPGPAFSWPASASTHQLWQRELVGRTDLFITCYLPGKALCSSGEGPGGGEGACWRSPFSIIKAGLACSLTLLSSRTRVGVI